MIAIAHIFEERVWTKKETNINRTLAKKMKTDKKSTLNMAYRLNDRTMQLARSDKDPGKFTHLKGRSSKASKGLGKGVENLFKKSF